MNSFFNEKNCNKILLPLIEKKITLVWAKGLKTCLTEISKFSYLSLLLQDLDASVIPIRVASECLRSIFSRKQVLIFTRFFSKLVRGYRFNEFIDMKLISLLAGHLTLEHRSIYESQRRFVSQSTCFPFKSEIPCQMDLWKGFVLINFSFHFGENYKPKGGIQIRAGKL